MLRIWIIGGTVVIVALVLWVRYLVYYRGFLPGYRGAIGIKNRSDVAIMTARVLGFTRVVACQNVARGGHSFSFLARQPLPERVEIIWRTATDGVEQQADVARLASRLGHGNRFTGAGMPAARPARQGQPHRRRRRQR